MYEGSEGDEWEVPSGPPLPRPDRLWIHPSEIRGPSGGPRDPMPRRRLSLGTVLVSTSIGALGMLTALAGGGLLVGFERDAAEETATAASPVSATLTTVLASSDDAMASVATLQVERTSGMTMTPAVALDDHGDLVISAAAIDQAKKIAMQAGDKSLSTATVVAVDNQSDLAVVHVAGVHTRSQPKTSPPRVGADIRLTPSDPVDRDRACVGRVSAVNETLVRDSSRAPIHGQMILSTTTTMTTAAVVTSPDGHELVGLVNPRGDRRGNELIFAIPINVALRIGRQLVANGRVHPGDLEITTETDVHATSGSRVMVDSVPPAAAAGGHPSLQVGDVILDIDQQPVRSTDDISGALAADEPGDEVTLLVEHGGVRRTVRVTLVAATSKA